MVKRVFVSFAIEDAYARDFLVQQAKDNRSPFEFTDMSVKEPWSSSWKTNCRQRIKGSDGVIALIQRFAELCSGFSSIVGMELLPNPPIQHTILPCKTL